MVNKIWVEFNGNETANKQKAAERLRQVSILLLLTSRELGEPVVVNKQSGPILFLLWAVVAYS